MTRLLFLLISGLLLASTACKQLPTGTSSTAPFDRQFIDMMVPHHEGAIEMAKIAQQRASHQEIKTMADDIIRSQSSEIDRLRAWRVQWYGSNQTPPMDRMPMVPGASSGMNMGNSTMDMAAEVAKLRQTGEPFDRTFIDAMVTHHQSAIDAAKAAESRAEHAETKTLATAIIDAQQKEIAQMQLWRKTWFGA